MPFKLVKDDVGDFVLSLLSKIMLSLVLGFAALGATVILLFMPCMVASSCFDSVTLALAGGALNYFVFPALEC
jgi:hypothetical protein